MKRRFFVSLLAFALTFSLLSSGIMIYAADAGTMTNGDNSEDTLSETSEDEEESSAEEAESDEGFAESTAEDAAASGLTAEETPEGAGCPKTSRF
ncbi:MAG: hypothetical protein LUE90_06885 [Clostridiales bacterium]|nr:hypothetical protein [Clostridiales bacterium]